MKLSPKIISTLIACLILPGQVLAQTVPLTPIPEDAAGLNISGVWTYSTGDHRNAGPCPGGTPMAGDLDIAVTADNAVSLDVLSGATCVPGSMCLYNGAIQAGNVVVGNSATVDDEGGKASNGMVLYFFSEDHGAGRVRSEYVHPGGMACTWTHRIELRRP